ncbi:hypothetical protein JCM8097_004120 [Rhodosporidiobolus ruineniae]
MLVVPLPGDDDPSDATLEALTGLGVALSEAKSVCCCLGAGVSTAAGVPDFRGTGGLYASNSTRSPTSPLSSLPDASLSSYNPTFPSSSQFIPPSSPPPARAKPLTPLEGFGGPQEMKHLFSFSALLQPESRGRHLRLMAALHDRAREIRKAEEDRRGGGKEEKRGKKRSRKGKERAVEPVEQPEEIRGPTAFHALLRRLDARSQLQRVWTQNIDGLEGAAGLQYVELADLDGPPSPSGESGEGEEGREQDSAGSDWEDTAEGRRCEEASTSLKRRQRSLNRPRPASSSSSAAAADEPASAEARKGTVVALHGTLTAVVCSICGFRTRWKKRHSRAFKRGESVACPQCEERAKTRMRASKRTTGRAGLAFLRPAVVLYDDTSFAAHSISFAVSALLDADLSSSSSTTSSSFVEQNNAPDLLLIAGTSLRIPGFKNLVKEVARAVKRRRGLCVMVNREAVGKEWEKVFDYHVLGDTEDFARSMHDLLTAFAQSAPPPTTSPASSSTSPRVVSPLPTPSTPPPVPLFSLCTSPAQPSDDDEPAVSSPPRPSPLPRPEEKKRRAAKRKRAVVDEDDDDEPTAPLPTPPPSSQTRLAESPSPPPPRRLPSKPRTSRPSSSSSSLPTAPPSPPLAVQLSALTSPQRRALGPAFLPPSYLPPHPPVKLPRLKYALEVPASHAVDTGVGAVMDVWRRAEREEKRVKREKKRRREERRRRKEAEAEAAAAREGRVSS